MIKLTLSFKGRILRAYHPTEAEILIGRGPDCDIPIDNLGVDLVHAKITSTEDEAVLQDLSADGGVLINGQRIEKQALEHGDEIQIGKHTLVFSREVPANAEQPAEPTLPPQSQRNGWLQFLNGPKLGRTLRLEHNLMRLGRPGGQSAMIASRSDGYYVSHLEGTIPTRVGDQSVAEASHKLQDGDTIQVGDTRVLFFVKE